MRVETSEPWPLCELYKVNLHLNWHQLWYPDYLIQIFDISRINEHFCEIPTKCGEYKNDNDMIVGEDKEKLSPLWHYQVTCQAT